MALQKQSPQKRASPQALKNQKAFLDAKRRHEEAFKSAVKLVGDLELDLKQLRKKLDCLCLGHPLCPFPVFRSK